MKLLKKGWIATSLAASLVHAAPQTWMSGIGDDANPCTRGAPCLTIAGTLINTFANGQISAIDPGDFLLETPATITSGVSIDCTAIPAELIMDIPGTAITINAGPSDVVVLRHLFLNGAGIGTGGIQFNSGKQLIIEDCEFIDFAGPAITVNLSNAGNVVVRNTSISNVTIGIVVNGTASPIQVSLENVSIQETTNAIDSIVGATEITQSCIVQNTTGIVGNGGVVSCSNSLVASNTTAIQALMGATVEISNNDFYDNTTTLDTSGGGDVATANNNRVAGSASPGSPTLSIIFQ